MAKLLSMLVCVFVCAFAQDNGDIISLIQSVQANVESVKNDVKEMKREMKTEVEKTREELRGEVEAMWDEKCDANRSGSENNEKCLGVIKCGQYGFCVGFEDRHVYCYGSSTGCLWNTTGCTSDSDCNKYSTHSKKFTDGDDVDCRKELRIRNSWRRDACTCDLSQKEVKFEKGWIGTSSRYSTSSACSQDNAFLPASNSYWQSGRDADGKGELAFPFPHLIWYDFKTTSFVPAQVSFRSASAGSGCEAKTGWCGATKYQFVGTNDKPCGRWSAWDVLCEDLSGEFFKNPRHSKYCRVPKEINKKYRCLGINVLESAYPGYITVAMAGIRMWKRVVV